MIFRVDFVYVKSYECREVDIGFGFKGVGRYGLGIEFYVRCFLIFFGMFVCLCGFWVRVCWFCFCVVGVGSV